jgi:hypothetical protein
MYMEMWQGSQILLGRAERDAQGNYWVLMSALLLTAFTFEAYLNHIGSKLFQTWNVLERLSPMEKLDVVCERLGISFPSGKRPHNSLRVLFRFRNDLAHGKNQTLSTDEFNYDDANLDVLLATHLKTKWEKLITWKDVKQVRSDVEIVMSKLHAAANPGHPLFSPGLTAHTITLVNT